MRSEDTDPNRSHLDSAADEVPASSDRIRTRLVSLADVLAEAERRINEFPIRKPVLDFLFANTRCSSMGRAEWEAHVRLATALDDVLRRRVRQIPIRDLIDENEIRSASGHAVSIPAALALGYHGGFALLRRHVFEHLFPAGVIVASHGRHAATDGAYALFAAREALLSGNPVLMAPDGNFGKETGTINVLGAQLLVADGSPFLAYTTKCNIEWFSVIRMGERFALRAVQLHGLQPGEKFPEFRERFYRFYIEQLELSLTGDPRNLSLRHPLWNLAFRAMLAGRVHSARRASG